MLNDKKPRDSWKLLHELTFTSQKSVKTTMDLTELNQAFADTVTSNNNTVTITPSCRNTADAFKFHQMPCSEFERMLATININTAT